MGEANLSVVSVLRPWAGFETLYEGQPAARPLMFSLTDQKVSSGGQPLDPGAGPPAKAGFDPHLLRGLAVPYGAKVVFWFPAIYAVGRAGVTSPIPYRWQIRWRLRSVADNNLFRIPFHIGDAYKGAPDTSGGPAEQRLLIPAATEPVIFTDTEPVSVFSTAIRQEWEQTLIVNPRSQITNYPLLPDGHDGYFQQGVFDPGAGIPGSTAGMPLYQTYTCIAGGDEMLLQVNRDATDVANWTFGTTDAQLSALFGSGSPSGPYPGIGVYVSTGMTST